MTQKDNSDPGAVHVNPVDRLGRRIDPAVLNVAEVISRRALRHAEKLLIDPAVAINLLEEAAATVSRAISAKPITERPIRDINSYLFLAFLRRVNKTRRRQGILLESLRIRSLDAANGIDPRRSLENKILIDEFLMQCGPTTPDMVWRHMAGFSWEEIGRLYGISSHAAESRVNHALQKARKRLGLR
jgi:DNA-directed RNA polymerase specialized sigma24 family protein